MSYLDNTPYFIDAIQEAITRQQGITIQGNGTKQHLGRHIERDLQVISTHDHRGILKYEPVELIMTARSGTTLSEIDAALAEHQQVLACDPASFGGNATIGGSLAANQAGPGRPWLGSLRDHVLGVNLINGKAERLQFGGQVMKNVAGYDASRLQAGAMGTLGLITEMSFKVLPKPATTTTLTHQLDQQEAIDLMNTLSAQAKPLSGACWVDGVLYLRLSGAQRAVDGTSAKWQGNRMPQSEADNFWRNLRDQQIAFFIDRHKDEPLWRFSLNSAAAAFLPNESWLIDWGGSQRWLKGDFDRVTLQQWAQTFGGDVLLYQGGNRSDEIAPDPNSVMKKLQQNIKVAFDPDHIFNRGRLYQWL